MSDIPCLNNPQENPKNYTKNVEINTIVNSVCIRCTMSGCTMSKNPMSNIYKNKKINLAKILKTQEGLENKNQMFKKCPQKKRRPSPYRLGRCQ